jgi:hypothetical protein
LASNTPASKSEENSLETSEESKLLFQEWDWRTLSLNPLFMHAFYFWRLTLLPLNLKRTLLKLLKKANSYFKSGTRDGLIPK